MNLTMSRWGSRNLLLQHLTQSMPSILLGGNIESPSQFVSCRAGPLEVGVISNQPAGTPQCEWLPDRDLLLAGYDKTLTAIDTAAARVRFDDRIEGVFFEFVVDQPRDQILAIHELGVVAIDFRGVVRWRFSSADILEEWQLSENVVRLSAMDVEPVLVDLENGNSAVGHS